MIRQFYVSTLNDLGKKIRELDIGKEDLIQVVYTGKEGLEWVVFYWQK